MYFSTGSWTFKRFHRVMARKLEWEPKKNERGRARGEEETLPSLFYAPAPTFSTNARGNACYAVYCGERGVLMSGGGGVLSGRLQYTCLPFITGLFIWGWGAGLSETGTVSTDLLGSFVLPGCELGGDPTKVKSTLDTELWKNVVQFGTLGYFTSETKKKCVQSDFRNGQIGNKKTCNLVCNIAAKRVDWCFTTHESNLSSNYSGCCRLRNVVAESRE